MKKVVVASLLAIAGISWVAGPALAQTQVNLGSNAQSSGGVQMSPAEYNAYNSAIGTTEPKAKAAAPRGLSNGLSAVSGKGCGAGAAHAGLQHIRPG